jgi:cytochrome c peroxidase
VSWMSRLRDVSVPKRMGRLWVAPMAAILLFESGCARESKAPLEAEAPDPAAIALAERAASIFGPLPSSVPNPGNVGSSAKLKLGRMLYYDARLSKNHDIACNSCHLLDAYGVDGEPTSPGHRGARGGRNSPTVYNAAIHVAQFWDGREPDVEAQAKGPVLNPIEMAAPSEEYVVGVLASIPGYVSAFSEAFPDDPDPLTYDNMARAIGAFERNLMTPGRFDAFMAGKWNALDPTERRGLTTFLALGCNSCHTGPAVGGALYRKLGFIFPYETQDIGRENVTHEASDRYVFKVPSLRNIVKTGPYFHDGSIATLEEVVRIMGYHQVGLQLEDAQIADIVAFLGSLTGDLNLDYVAKPELPESGSDTPPPDPS